MRQYLIGMGSSWIKEKTQRYQLAHKWLLHAICKVHTAGAVIIRHIGYMRQEVASAGGNRRNRKRCIQKRFLCRIELGRDHDSDD